MSDVSRVEEVFLAAVEKLDPVQRATYLDAACGDDEDFRRRVETLLAAQPQVGHFLESPVDLAPTGVYQERGSKLESTASIGDRVGPYKLLERIGEGGMGEVWVADQQEPIKRRVALKLIKPGMDSRSVLGRFEAERQALAVMDHPNIAKVLDAGTTKDGRPYFVMELVKGTPITEFADARQLTPQQRLEMFVPVCQAIQHAHMKGIIHRDIKPSNVLVALHDEMPVPKVIDFGVAKAVGQQLTEKTIYTGFGALVGTPAYMAPEQATFNQLDIDTRADVYALGVLLYELLAGSPPIESERLKKAALDEVLRIVRDEEPPRPSQRLSTSHLKASIAATRGSEPLKLSQLMRGELDWIVMKALEKDRTRRYETANGLASDVQRYLCGEQVQAVPPSLGYRLKKAYRRNKMAVQVASGFTLLLLTAVIISSLLAVRATRAEALAEEKRIESEANAEQAKQNADAWSKVSEMHFEAAVDAEIRSVSARLDADLLEYKSDPRLGLLRLARPMNHSFGPLPTIGPNFTRETYGSFEENLEFVKLREFQAAAVITAGQEFVPLVPPLHHDGNSPERSREQGLSIIGDERYGLQLVAVPSLQQIGVLRESNERLVKWGFSPDGKTIYTQDTDSIVRFWNADGTFRAKTPIRPERFVYPAAMTIEQVRDVSDRTNSVRVVDGIVVLHSQPPEAENPGKDSEDTSGFLQPSGSHDLYDTRTGQFIRRLDRPDCDMRYFQLVANDRWLIYYEYDRKVGKHPDCQLVIVSTDDGRELARLPHSTDQPTKDTYISPTGKWVVTLETDDPKKEKMIDRVRRVRLWNSANWQQVENETSRQLEAMLKTHLQFWFVTDDIVDVSSLTESDIPNVFSSNHNFLDLSRPRHQKNKETIGIPLPWGNTSGELGSLLIRMNRTLIDAKTFERLKPPSGRKYHPDLAKLAPDGRFFENLDTVTEKELPLYQDDSDGFYFNSYGLGFGQFGLIWNRRQDWYQLYILPDPVRLTIPPAMLELWAQLVTGGELGSDGLFEAWDEPKWTAKQKELAAMTPPYADFPFPGWAATEPNLWYRIRANELASGKERDRLLDEWQRRTGRTGPHQGPDPWRTPGPAEAASPEADPVGLSNTSNTTSPDAQTSQ
jgi:serine/threonine protein kinase